MKTGKKITDPALVREIRAAILISSAMGSMDAIKSMETAKHTRRARTLDKAFKALNDVLKLYPRALEYDLIKLGEQFYDGLDDRLNQIIAQGLIAHGNVLSCVERWQRGDVLLFDTTVGIIEKVREDGYDIAIGSTVLFSEANWPDNPYLITWEKIGALGEECTEQQIRDIARKTDKHMEAL